MRKLYQIQLMMKILGMNLLVLTQMTKVNLNNFMQAQAVVMIIMMNKVDTILQVVILIMMTTLICCHPQTHLQMNLSKPLQRLMKNPFMKRPQLVKIMEAPHNNQMDFMTHPLKQNTQIGKDAMDAD